MLLANKKTAFAVATITTVILLLSSLSALNCQTSGISTLPITINTYGDAWSGIIAFDVIGPAKNCALVVMDTNGTILSMRQSYDGYGSTYNIARDTLLFQGEHQVDGADNLPVIATHIWNFATNTTQDFPNVISHHDVQYNPNNNTFMVLQSYARTINGTSVLFDKLLQVNSEGDTLWSWDTYDHIPLSEMSPFNETTTFNGETVVDFTHSNAIDWDYNNNIVYLNARHTNTFYKIDQNTGKLIWACGQYGDFTLLDNQGDPVSSLWYHSHNTKQVAPNVFTMFDNDFQNVTNPNNCRSSLLQLTLNETSMTAQVTWIWEAPKQYWNFYGGAMVALPNGDYLGDFGDPTHQLPNNQPWDFTNTGAVIVEVNPAGQIMRTFTFPVGWFSYRVQSVTNITTNNPSSTPTAQPQTPISTPTSTSNPTTPSTTPIPIGNPAALIAALTGGAVVAVIVAVMLSLRYGKKVPKS